MVMAYKYYRELKTAIFIIILSHPKAQLGLVLIHLVPVPALATPIIQFMITILCLIDQLAFTLINTLMNSQFTTIILMGHILE